MWEFFSNYLTSSNLKYLRNFQSTFLKNSGKNMKNVVFINLIKISFEQLYVFSNTITTELFQL